MYIDFHTHRQRQTGKALEILSCHQANSHPTTFYTIGFHPWWSLEELSPLETASLSNYYLNDAMCLGIGECGLDKLKGPFSNVQEQIFLRQIEIANYVNAPLIVHCVRQYDQMLRIHREYAKTNWVVHGFVRNKLLAKSILDQGIYLSVAPHHNMSMSFMETLKYIPIGSLFIETDSEISHDIFDRYKILADHRNIDIKDMKIQIQNNFEMFFYKKIFPIKFESNINI